MFRTGCVIITAILLSGFVGPPPTPIRYENAQDLQALTRTVIEEMVAAQPLRNEARIERVVTHGIVNETERFLDLVRLTAGLEDALSKTGKAQILRSPVREMHERELGVRGADLVSRKRMLHYARQNEADLMLTGSIAPARQRAWHGLWLERADANIYRMTVELVDPQTRAGVWRGEYWLLREAGDE